MTITTDPNIVTLPARERKIKTAPDTTMVILQELVFKKKKITTASISGNKETPEYLNCNATAHIFMGKQKRMFVSIKLLTAY